MPANTGRSAGAGRNDGQGPGGIPDGLLLGVIALLLGMTGLVWTATGLSGLLTHGSWPDGVTFTRAPLALRALFTDPRDLPGAWPSTPPGQLSSHGFFWGVFVSQILVLATLAVAVLTAVARWRLRRHHGHTATTATAGREDQTVPAGPHPGTQPQPGATPPAPAAAQTREPATPQPPAEAPADTPTAEPPQASGTPAAPVTAPTPATAPATTVPTPHPAAAEPPRTFQLHHGDAEQQRALAEQTIVGAPGAVLVVTPRPVLWSTTSPMRGKVGPTHLYDPAQRAQAGRRLRWSPTHRCEDMDTARRRAAALLAPVRPRSRLDSALADTAETLLRCWLHAAAVSGAPFRQVHRWASGNSQGEAVRLLRTRTAAASGAAGELESVLTAHPERRDAAMALVQRALTAHSRLHVRNSCIGSRPDALALESFVPEGGTVYIVGDAIEDPRRGDPGTTPFATALLSHVVETGRRMAERSSPGRLDPPLTLVLDQLPQVAPLPDLPSLATDGHVYGFRTLVLLRSEEQTRYWWPPLASDGF